MTGARLRKLIAAVGAQGLVRAAGLSRDYLLARWIGFGPDLDPYFLAFSVMVIALGVIASVLHIGLVPAFSRGTAELSRSTAGWILAVGAVATAIGIVLTRVISGGLVAALLLIALVPAAGSVVLGARLIAADRQIAGVMPGIALAVVPVAGAALLGRTVGLDALIAISLLAYFGELLALFALCQPHLVPNARRLGSAFDANAVRGLGGASLIGTAWLATDLAFVRALGHTEVSIYSLAVRIPQGLGGVLVPAITNALLPAASLLLAQVEDFARAWRSIRRNAMIAVAAGAVLAVINGATALVLNEFAFAGSAVTADAAVEIFTTQGVLGLMLPAYLAGLVIVRYLQTAGQHGPILTIGIATLLLNIVADATFSHWWGVPGIAAATALAYTFSFTMLMVAGARLARQHET